MSTMAPPGYLTTWTFGERLSHLLVFAAATGRLSPTEVAEIELAMDEERRLAVSEELRRRELVDYLLRPDCAAALMGDGEAA